MENARSLSPTLWRTCRALANRRRLAVLRFLLRHQRQCVSDVAAQVGISESSASQCLRALNARGILDARRTSRWVVYTVSPNSTISFSEALVTAMKRQLSRRLGAIEGAFRNLTAFTHPRRIRIVRELNRSPGLSIVALVVRCGISLPAMKRHVSKLVRRDIVVRNQRGTYALARKLSPLAHELVRIACMEG